jgi:hypothetical protein
MSPPSVPSSQERAAFAVSSRLLSCFVTESLLRAFYLPFRQVDAVSGASGAVVVLSTQLLIERTLHSSDIFAIVAARRPPVLKDVPLDDHGYAVALLDPLDMLPIVYDLAESSVDDAPNVSHVHFLIGQSRAN